MWIKTRDSLYDSSIFKYFEIKYAGMIEDTRAYAIYGVTTNKQSGLDPYNNHKLFCGTEDLCREKLQAICDGLTLASPNMGVCVDLTKSN